jgi:hypothetical protein
MVTLEQCASYLAELSRSGEYSECRIDTCVSGYPVLFKGYHSRVIEEKERLAQAFREAAPESDLSERIRKRILREDQN